MGYNKVLLEACQESIGNLGNMLENQTLEKQSKKKHQLKKKLCYNSKVDALILRKNISFLLIQEIETNFVVGIRFSCNFQVCKKKGSKWSKN